MTHEILIVDDEPLVRRSLRRLLSRGGWHVSEAESGEAARDLLARRRFDVAVIDYKLGGMTGLEVLALLRAQSPQTLPILLTAYGNVGLAVEAIRNGAFDFLEKDGDPQLTLHVVERALEQVRLQRELAVLQREQRERSNRPQIICRSRAMREVLETADEYARTAATVLLEGETGAGKSLLAEYIHCASERGNGPFVTINCGAIPKELIESELFGYAEGAFTGAKRQGKMGLIRRADGGTLFLDEIGDLSLELQSKLLHVLETREFLAVGSVEPTRVDVRFLAATNADLKERIAEGRFRRDLYYRLNVAALRLPPLRERRDDVLPLATHFAHKLGQQYRKPVTAITAEAEQRLTAHSWPGNIRELRNAIERAIVLNRTGAIDTADLRFLDDADGAAGCDGAYHVRVDFCSGANVIDELMQQVVLHAWQQSQHNQSQAARLLGIPRTTFQTYVQRFGL